MQSSAQKTTWPYKFQKEKVTMVHKLFAVNQTKKTMNSGNWFHATMHISKERTLFTLEVFVEKLLMSVKEKLTTIKKLFNGHTMETKIKSGLLNQYGDDL